MCRVVVGIAYKTCGQRGESKVALLIVFFNLNKAGVDGLLQRGHQCVVGPLVRVFAKAVLKPRPGMRLLKQQHPQTELFGLLSEGSPALLQQVSQWSAFTPDALR